MERRAQGHDNFESRNRALLNLLETTSRKYRSFTHQFNVMASHARSGILDNIQLNSVIQNATNVANSQNAEEDIFITAWPDMVQLFSTREDKEGTRPAYVDHWSKNMRFHLLESSPSRPSAQRKHSFTSLLP